MIEARDQDIRGGRGPGRRVSTVDSTPSAALLLPLTVSVTAMVLGLLWDISWDGSIGVDSFWSPPHLTLNLGAVAAGVLAVVVAASAARRSGAGDVSSLAVAAAAGIVGWGAVAMVGWMVLDAWWSGAYGLYAARWSPPEILFTMAAVAILTGAAAVVGVRREPLGAAARLWIFGLAAAFATTVMTPLNLANLQRTATFHLVAAMVFPVILAAAAAGSRRRWGATEAALAYSLFVMALVWIFPRFAAQPRIGPVYEPVGSLLPPPFPLLLVVAAPAIDLALGRWRSNLARAAVAAVAFVGVFFPVQWLFAAFLLSPAADNGFFAGGGRYWPFYAQVGPERALFWGREQDPLSVATVGACLIAAAASAWIGLRLGGWMRELR